MFLFVFISLLCTLKRGLKYSAEPMFSTLNLSQVIAYMKFLLLQERYINILMYICKYTYVYILSVHKYTCYMYIHKYTYVHNI